MFLPKVGQIGSLKGNKGMEPIVPLRGLLEPIKIKEYLERSFGN